jgi:hypothetical protein
MQIQTEIMTVSIPLSGYHNYPDTFKSFDTIAVLPATSSCLASEEPPRMTPPSALLGSWGCGLLWEEFQKGGDPRLRLSFTYCTILKTMLCSNNAQESDCILGFTLLFQCCYTLGIDETTKRKMNSPHFMANKHID